MDPAYPGGDLARLGYLPAWKQYRENTNDLPLRHVDLRDFRGGQVDLVTIGDSFSNGGGKGRNSYYQDYIASINRLKVLNLPQLRDLDSVTAVSIMNNNGYLDRIRPKYVVIQSVERLAMLNLPERFDLDRNMPEAEMRQLPTVAYGSRLSHGKGWKLDFFSEGNYNFLRNGVLYRFNDHAFLSKVYLAELDRPLFTFGKGKTLLFFEDDVKNRHELTRDKISRLNEGLNRLQDRLARKGIRLYYMPCVDKYNLYSDYLVKNNYPRSTFFEELRSLPKRYRLIDTKAILKEELERGEKDVYFVDDTHWNWKASEKVFTTVRFAGRESAGR